MEEVYHLASKAILICFSMFSRMSGTIYKGKA
jgi:hypothetical protein